MSLLLRSQTRAVVTTVDLLDHVGGIDGGSTRKFWCKKYSSTPHLRGGAGIVEEALDLRSSALEVQTKSSHTLRTPGAQSLACERWAREERWAGSVEFCSGQTRWGWSGASLIWL